MFTRIRNLLLGLIAGLTLASCGGGGGSQVAEGGIGGTGISTGTVTGFGSVYVNGVKYETAGTVFTGDDNEDGTETHLEEGMVVTVKGTINNDGVTGSAISIEYEDLIEGPVSAKGANTLTVMGHTVIVDSNTKYNGTTFASISTSPSDEIEVSGFYDENYNINATYIELSSSGIQEISGRVTDKPIPNVNFEINGILLVNSSTSVNIGDYVEVKGSYSNILGELTATSVEIKPEGFDIDNENVAEREGIATTPCVFTTECTFLLNGVTVKVDGNTEFDTGTPNDITAGRLLEVEGSLVNGELIATEIEFEDESEVEAEIASVVDNGGTKTITLTGITGLEVIVDSDPNVTEFDASSYSGITAGEHLKFRGMMNGGQLFVTRVESGSSPDIELEGVVESYSGIAETVTVMGVTVSTTGLSLVFDDDSVTGQALTSTQFYNYLNNNEANIEIKGTLSGGVVTWEEIELDL